MVSPNSNKKERGMVLYDRSGVIYLCYLSRRILRSVIINPYIA
jgi:hypothetical protein